jgi:hypothetical protein
MAYVDLDNLDHDPDLASALGNMLIAWAKAETALVASLAYVAGIHFNLASVAYYRIPTFESRVKVILAMIEEWDADDQTRVSLTKAIKKLSSLSATRNGWVHGIWCQDETTGATVTANLRAQDNSRITPTKSHDVNDHVRAVLRRSRDVENLIPLTVARPRP